MHHIPTPVVAVGALVDGEPIGMVVGSFVVVSFDPTVVSFSVKRSSTTWPILERAERVGLSVLTESHEAQVRQLAGPRERRFDGVEWSSDGEAVLLGGASAHLAGKITRQHDVGDHVVVLVEPDLSRQVPGAAPLVYYRSRFDPVQAP